MKSYRIAATDLNRVCHHLICSSYSVLVVGCGSMYATIEADEEMLKVLTKNNIHWTED